MKLEKLSKDQEQKMIEVRDFWMDYIFSCKNSLNREKVKEGVKWLYDLANHKEPVVVYVDSPVGCQLAVTYLKEFIKQVGGVRASVWDSVGDSVGDSVWDSVWASVWASVRDSVGDSVRDSVWASVRDSVGDSVRDSVWASVWDSVGDSEIEYSSFAQYGSISDYGWVSFYDFFTQIGVLDHQKFNEFKNILLSGVYDMVQLNGFCIVSDMPNIIVRNSDNQLHNTDGAAIEFKDGYRQYYVNGLNLSKDLFDRLSRQEVSFEDFVKEENEEVKSAILAFYRDKFGDEFMFRFLSNNLKEIDTYVDKKAPQYLEGTTGGMNIGVYTLFKGRLMGEDIAFVRCYCPSTDRMFFLGVEPVNTNAKDAIASLYRVPRKLRDHITTINRQGEVYSTNFTNEGLELLKTIEKKDIQDLVGIDGDTYFSKIRYEY